MASQSAKAGLSWGKSRPQRGNSWTRWRKGVACGPVGTAHWRAEKKTEKKRDIVHCALLVGGLLRAVAASSIALASTTRDGGPV
ncbi:hypothetical protein KFL_002390025 [Klebsormidium nitens]|uniref:Uncharacterized protein n=1 Tax=Klebsormidium nitens TaxID=105231 RepID=A0A1Y1I7V1_KLENI|nr:hypothetical protein KFL_002390025 [Klebsormidium nitens]|eukprot:GAQ85509.1 hypothetical protein KFL_002390025 [Klebsormidium nitens]